MDNIQTSYTNTLKRKEEKVKTIIGKNLAQINLQHNTSLQLSRFTDLKVVEELGIITEAGLDKDENEDQGLVFFINGCQQPTDKQLFEKFTYLFIRMLDSKIDHKSYTLVYFVGDELLSSGFTRFRQFMKKQLPVKYYVRMKQMYVYHASLLVRSFLFFENSKRGKLWKKKTRFIGSLQELFETSNFHKRWIDLVPVYFRDQIDMTDLYVSRQESMNLNPDAQVAVSIFGRNLDSYTLNQMGIPEILDHLLSYFCKKPERFHSQGIFRRSGSVSEQLQLAQLLSEGRYKTLQIIHDVNIVADIIKKYFHSLTVPLINFTLYDQIVSVIPTILESDYMEFIQIIMEKMPALNRKVLAVMLSFLYDVIKYEEQNLMTSYNISVVFAPCLMWSQHQSNQEIFNIGICIKFVFLMLKYFPIIFPGISYKIYLAEYDRSGSSSGYSSADIDVPGNQLSEEESKEQQQQINGNFLPMQHDLLEFSIDSILTNLIQDQPMQDRQKMNSDSMMDNQ